VVLQGELPAKLKEAAEMYVGCVAGATQKDRYMIEIFSAGFVQVKVEKEAEIVVPDEVFGKYLTPDEISKLREGNVKILSITVTGVKPAGCCDCSSGCC